MISGALQSDQCWTRSRPGTIRLHTRFAFIFTSGFCKTNPETRIHLWIWQDQPETRGFVLELNESREARVNTLYGLVHHDIIFDRIPPTPAYTHPVLSVTTFPKAS